MRLLNGLVSVWSWPDLAGLVLARSWRSSRWPAVNNMQKNWTDCRRKSVNCGQFQTTRQAEGALLLLVTRRQAAGSTCSLLVFVGWAKHRNSTDCATLKTITMKRNDSENGHVSSFSFWSSHKIVFICAGHINKYWQRVTWRYGVHSERFKWNLLNCLALGPSSLSSSKQTLMSCSNFLSLPGK